MRDTELVSDLLHGVRPAPVEPELVIHVLRDRRLPGREIGFWPPVRPRARGVKAVAGAFGHQGVLKLGDRAEDLKNIRPTAIDVSIP